jgi:hypothetical protein
MVVTAAPNPAVKVAKTTMILSISVAARRTGIGGPYSDQKLKFQEMQRVLDASQVQFSRWWPKMIGADR